MILTTCAACAAPLAHTAPRCVRCHTRYCDATCQHDHWRRGHKQICKKIHRGGNAEQYNADKKYKEAVAVAVAKCVDDTKGQKCYICLEAVHPRTGEGLVRGCGCGDRDGVSSPELGVAHVSCLMWQAKELNDEAEESKLRGDAWSSRRARWYKCGLCEQEYHGVVRCALGWACWKTYVGRPEGDWARRFAMTQLGNGLYYAGHHADALTVQEAELSIERRLGDSVERMLTVQSTLASSYQILGRNDDVLRMRRDVYSGRLKLHGQEHHDTLLEAINYASGLINSERFEATRSLLRKTIPVARRVLGEGHGLTLQMRANYGAALFRDPTATVVHLREAVTTYEETRRISNRVLGAAHPVTKGIEGNLRTSRAVLGARETPRGSSKGSN